MVALVERNVEDRVVVGDELRLDLLPLEVPNGARRIYGRRPDPVFVSLGKIVILQIGTAHEVAIVDQAMYAPNENGTIYENDPNERE